MKAILIVLVVMAILAPLQLQSLFTDSDLLIVIGSSFSDFTQLPQKKTIQIDINMKNIAKKYPVEVGLLGNSAILIPKLTKLVQQRPKPEYLERFKTQTRLAKPATKRSRFISKTY